MKKTLLVLALGSCVFGGQAMAAAVATGDLTLSQTTPNTCAIMTSPTLSGGGFSLNAVSFAPGPGTVTATVTAPASLIDGTTAQLNATGGDYNVNNALAFLATNNSFTLSWQAHCNFSGGNKRVRLTSQNGGLILQGSNASIGSFSDGLGTIMQVEWPLPTGAFVSTSGNSGVNSLSVPLLLPINQTMRLRVKINKQLRGTTVQPANPANRAPLLQGSYSDTVRVAFGAPV